MRKVRKPLLIAGLVFVFSVAPFVSLAQTIVPLSVFGAEEPTSTSTLGIFDGVAFGPNASGVWHAEVPHDPLPNNVGGSAAVNAGGEFVFAGRISGASATVSGQFGGGTILFVSQEPGCGRQVYNVSGSLLPDASATILGGSFNVTLTHHRKIVFGLGCSVVFASVVGRLVNGQGVVLTVP